MTGHLNVSRRRLLLLVSLVYFVLSMSELRAVGATSHTLQSFEEYLLNVTSEARGTDGSGEVDSDDVDETTRAPPTDELLNYFRSVPREHWSCCMLGVLAGSKGFHCQADYYSATATVRNANRAHTARQPPLGGRASASASRYEITRTFRRCSVVASPSAAAGGVGAAADADEFHKCCYVATEERRELRRARRFRQRAQSRRRRR